MQSIPIINYIIFGTELRFLQDVKEGWEIKGHGWIMNNIDRFFEHLDEYNLPVTKRASFELKKFRKKIQKDSHANSLDGEEVSELSEIVTDIRKTLIAEASGKIAYIITDKRIDIDKLVFDPISLLPSGTFYKLPKVSQSDFVEACNCIAFDLPTASAFHILRSTECVLRKYYLSLVKRDRIKGNLMWGPMLDALENRKKKLESALLNNLSNIKNSFRNPTDHPEKIYDIEEAQDLFNQCVDVINRMSSSRYWDETVNLR